MEKKSFHCDHAQEVYENLPSEDMCINIADFYKIFSDSSRVRILFAMLDKEICVHDISLMLNMSQSSVSHQLKTLRHNKVVKVRRVGKLAYYSLADTHIKNVVVTAKIHLDC